MKKWTNKRRVTATLTTLGATALSIAGAAGLAKLFASTGSEDPWPAAISAVSTIVLVVVTSIYVFLTGMLVKLQGEANKRTAKQEDARVVRRVLESLFPAQAEVLKVLKLFPLDSAKGLSAIMEEDVSKEINNVSDYLRTMAVQLPGALAMDSIKTATKISRAVTHCQIATAHIFGATAESIRLKTETPQGDRGAREVDDEESVQIKITWDQVKASFYADEKHRKLMALSEGRMPEWDEINQGIAVQNALDALVSLEDKMRLWLRS